MFPLGRDTKATLELQHQTEFCLQNSNIRREDMSSFVTGKQLEGYTVIGIEQTDRSVILGSKNCVFPLKSVLVIGAEKQGIPPNILAQMDFCVEIKQVEQPQ